MNALISKLKSKGIKNDIILQAMAQVPREAFIPKSIKNFAYEDIPLAIGEAQTISQPFIVALMTDTLIQNRKLHKVLEIGTGSGYQAAILSLLVDEVYTIERIFSLYQKAQKRLQKLGYHQVHCIHADGCTGWLQEAPYDGIIVTAAAETIPQSLIEQLDIGARLVIPVCYQGQQNLMCITKTQGGIEQRCIERVLFVPLIPGL